MINLKDYGYTEADAPKEGLIPGRVTEHMRDRYTVITQYGEVSAVLLGAFVHNVGLKEELPHVGDFVLLKHNETGVSQISEVLPRRTKFSRANTLGSSSGHIKHAYEQVVAANFDYVFIISSLNQDFNISRIIRYHTQTLASGGIPVVILTKADLDENHAGKVGEVEKVLPGVPVLALSSHTGYGLSSLSEFLKPGKTVVFLGMSGVGKSSLLNTLMNQDVMEVKSIREDDSRGRHTTTHRELFMLPGGAMVIDTPGMRELGLYDAEESIRSVYKSIDELTRECRFSDCGHEREPGCAIKRALRDGSLSKKDWEKYQAGLRETNYIEKKTEYMRIRNKEHKSLSKFGKELKKSGKIRY